MVILHNMLLVAQIALVAYQVSSFTSTHSTYIQRQTSNTKLYQFIKADSEEDVSIPGVDENSGGVGLAKRCAIKCIGSVSSTSDGRSSEFDDLIRYDKLTSIDKSIVEQAKGVTILTSGEGKEAYQDPGQSNRVEDRVILLAPMDAVQKALSTIKC